jgi:hypothetical protein
MSSESVSELGFKDIVDQQYYTKRKEGFQMEVSKLDATISRYSLVRIVVASAFIAFGYLAFTNLAYATALPFLMVLFFWLVKVQSRKERERNVLIHLVHLNEWEADALHFKFSNFPSGDAFIVWAALFGVVGGLFTTWAIWISTKVAEIKCPSVSQSQEKVSE